MFYCPRFAMEGRDLNQVPGRNMIPKRIVAEMQRLKEYYLTVPSAIVKIRNELMKEERRRKDQRTRIVSA